MMGFFDGFREVAQQPEVAGTAGSLLSLRWMPLASTWRNKVASFASGLAVSVWLVPLAVETLGMKSPGAVGAFGFLGGLFGLLLISRAWDYISTTPAGEWITAIFAKRPQ